MGCYIIPATAAIIHYFLRRKIPSMNNKHHVWLNLLFAGGGIFGVIDHLWNGELFMLSENLLLDLALGLTITLAIILTWKFIVVCDKLSKDNPTKVLD